MNRFADFTISRRATLLDAVERIERNHSRAVIVTDDGKVIGVVGEGDVLRALLNGVDIHAPLDDFVQHNFKYLHEPDAGECLELFRRHGITMVPIVDKDLRLTGILTLREVLEGIRPSGGKGC
jgi:CBS domain-containing protein